jgi:hypothetical protein
MLFLALGKAKGPAESQTVKPILIITPPPEPSNQIPIDPQEQIIFDVNRRGSKKGDKKLIHQLI